MIIDIVLFYHTGQGGVETVLTIFNREMKKRGHKLRFFAAKDPEFSEWKNTLDEIIIYGNEANYSLENLVNGYINEINYIEKPDVIIATGSTIPIIISKLAIEKLGLRDTKLVSWMHSRLINIEYLHTLSYCDAHFAICNSIEKEISDVIGSNENIYVLKNPVFYKDIKKLKIRNDNILDLVYIGRLDYATKRVDIMLKALSLFENDNWKLRIIGNGEYKEYYKELAIMLEIEKNIEWIEWCSNPWEIVNEATALILTSDNEGTPMVLVEALSRGLPVISSNYKGVEDIVINNENGFIFERGNYEKLYELLNNICIGECELPTSEQCIESVLDQRIDYTIDKFEAVLNDIVNY